MVPEKTFLKKWVTSARQHAALFGLVCVAAAGLCQATAGIAEEVRVGELAVSAAEELHQREFLNLDELIIIALRHNQALEIFRQKLAQSQGRLTMSRSNYLPQLVLEGRYFYTERQDSASTTEVSDQGTSVLVTDEVEEDDIMYGGLSLSQLIYDFGKTSGAITSMDMQAKAAEAELQRQVQEVLYQVKEAYYSVLEKQRLIDVARESLKSFQQHLDRAKLYYKTGVRTKIDVINAEVEYSNAKMNLIRAQYNLKTARVALEQVLGVPPNGGAYSLYDDGVDIDNVLESMPPVEQELDDLLSVAMEKRPDLLQLQHLVEAARANVKSAKGDYWPSLTADVKYNDYDTDLSLYKDSWEVGVGASWKLFSGFHTRGAVAEATGSLLESRARMQEMQLAITSEVTDSYLKADENRESVQIALQTLGLARENVALAEKRYESGSYDVIEFNDAQLSLTRTLNELVVTYYNYLTAYAGIEYAIGASLVTIPQ